MIVLKRTNFMYVREKKKREMKNKRDKKNSIITLL